MSIETDLQPTPSWRDALGAAALAWLSVVLSWGWIIAFWVTLLGSPLAFLIAPSVGPALLLLAYCFITSALVGAVLLAVVGIPGGAALLRTGWTRRWHFALAGAAGAVVAFALVLWITNPSMLTRNPLPTTWAQSFWPALFAAFGAAYALALRYELLRREEI